MPHTANFVIGRRKLENLEESPLKTQGEPAQKLYTGGNLSSGLNRGPWNCETVMLPAI